MAPGIAVFEQLADARRARKRMVEAGADPDQLAVVARHLPLPFRRNETIDGNALGEAMGTGVELGVVAAIPIIGPILAMGPLQRIATSTQQRLKDAFQDLGCAPDESREAEAAVEAGKTVLVFTGDHGAFAQTVRALGGILFDRPR